jgi:hypothetical protein
MQVNDLVYYTLGQIGYTGSYNDRLYKYLGDKSYTGTLDDRLRSYFEYLGYPGSLTDQYSKWVSEGFNILLPFTVEYVSITDSNIADTNFGIATNSVDGGNNTGWTFI